MPNFEHFTQQYEVDVLQETTSKTIDVGALTTVSRDRLEQRLEYMGWDIVKEDLEIWTITKREH